MRSLLLALVLLLGTKNALAYDDYDYCVDIATADRIDCNAQYLDTKSLCASDKAFDLWIGLD